MAAETAAAAVSSSCLRWQNRRFNFFSLDFKCLACFEKAFDLDCAFSPEGCFLFSGAITSIGGPFYRPVLRDSDRWGRPFDPVGRGQGWKEQLLPPVFYLLVVLVVSGPKANSPTRSPGVRAANERRNQPLGPSPNGLSPRPPQPKDEGVKKQLS